MTKIIYSVLDFCESPDEFNTLTLVQQELSYSNVNLLASVIRASATIQSINFQGGSINDSAAENLFTAIMTNENIKTLAISCMSLSDYFIGMLINSLEGNQTLNALLLNNNEIEDLNAMSIVAVVKESKIKNLQLKSNRISKVERDEIENIVSDNKLDINMDSNKDFDVNFLLDYPRIINPQDILDPQNTYGSLGINNLGNQLVSCLGDQDNLGEDKTDI